MALHFLFCEKWENKSQNYTDVHLNKDSIKIINVIQSFVNTTHVCADIGEGVTCRHVTRSRWALPNPASNGLHPAGPQYVLQECSEILQGCGPCWANTKNYCLGFFFCALFPLAICWTKRIHNKFGYSCLRWASSILYHNVIEWVKFIADFLDIVGNPKSKVLS